ncbi:MAG: hypothetical protein IT170_13370 [Bryobacterales bacterium]|nr:hypothetical protein [Bryobacterales bacterium]
MNTKRLVFLFALGLLHVGFLVCSLPAQERARIDLNGEWAFQLDPGSLGETAGWSSGRQPFPEKIQVPGAWQAQGFGEPSGVLRHHYSGKAWYRRDVPIPADWKDRVVALRIGGVLRRGTFFVNGQNAGTHDGFSTPFSLDVSKWVRAGATNTFVFLVDNTAAAIETSPDKQKANDPTGMINYIGNWGGIYGNVELEAMPRTWIGEVAIHPEIQGPRARFQIAVHNEETGAAHPARIEVEAGPYRGYAEITVRPGAEGSAEVNLEMPGAVLWSPDTPQLYNATVRLISAGRERDRIHERFGVREITTRGRELLLNGKPFYLRGFGDDNIEVINGVPAASKEVHLERLRKARAYGFNGVRFHSMTPVREYFEAADEAGILVMAELPAAYTMYVLPHREFLRKELERVLRVHRNHPSFLSLAFGNEFDLTWLSSDAERKEFLDTIESFYRLAKSIDPTRVILSNDGYVMRPTDMVSVFRNPPGDVPAVRHEFGNYYCSLPDISLTEKFTGLMNPAWLTEKKAWVEKNHLMGEYPTLVHNSQLLQQVGRKFQIERARRMPEFTGYHYWLIVDYPGGTGEGDSWEEGWFDYFWQPKSVSPEAGRELNSGVLLMIEPGIDDRTMWSDTPKRIQVSISNYGGEDITGGQARWTLSAEGRALSSGVLTGVDAPVGSVKRIGGIVLEPLQLDRARKLELVLETTVGKARFTNRWNLWAFPRGNRAEPAEGAVVSDVRWAGIQRLYPTIQPAGERVEASSLLITSKLDAKALQQLEAGGRVWLMAGREQFEAGGDATFLPPSGGAQGTLLRNHPALEGFPHDGYCDLQFFNLLEGAWNLPLDRWPQSIVPIAGGIRTTASFLAKQKPLSKTGYVVELKVGKGRLLITTLRLRDHLDEAYPEALYLFDRLLRYATGPEFNPEAEITGDALRRLPFR